LPAGPVVKVCGLTRAEDVVLARDLGAWAVGFVFAPSPRRLAPAAARELIDQVARRALVAQDSTPKGRHAGMPAPLTVGVFGDVSTAEVASVAEQVGLDVVQLHGESGPEVRSVRKALAGWELPLRLAGGSPHGSRPREKQGSPYSACHVGGEPKTDGILIIRAVPVDADGEQEDILDGLRRRVEEASADADLILFDTRGSGRFGGSGNTFSWRLVREAAPRPPVLVAGGIGPDNVQIALKDSGAWGVDVSSKVEASPGIKDARLMESLFGRVGGL